MINIMLVDDHAIVREGYVWSDQFPARHASGGSS